MTEPIWIFSCLACGYQFEGPPGSYWRTEMDDHMEQSPACTAQPDKLRYVASGAWSVMVKGAMEEKP